MKALLKRLREPRQKTAAEGTDAKPSSPSAANASFLPRRHRTMVIVFGAVFLLTVVAYWLGDSTPGGSLTSGGPRQTHFEVVVRPATRELRLTGTLVPSEEHTVTAPFEGIVLEKHVSLGQRVAAGDVLARINTRDVEIRLREAESALIKARRQLEQLENWESSPEVNSAKRTLAQSERRLDNLSRRVEQSERLLDIGIIAEGDYEGELEQLQNQRMDVISAEEALASTLRRGDAAEQEVAALEVENAAIRAERLRETMAGAAVRAPINGIVVAAKSAEGSRGGELGFNVGDKVTEGKALLSIANTDELIVQSSVDEIDINSIELGQAATIVSGSLPGVMMTGRLSKIAYQASTDGTRSSRFPGFDIELTLDEGASDERLRLGVSVQVTIALYRKEEAIVVPFGALERGPEGLFVRVVTGGDEWEKRPVTAGMSVVDGVEVLSGLQVGDVLLVDELQPAFPQVAL